MHTGNVQPLTRVGAMPRRTSTNSLDKDNLSEESIPTLPILTRLQHRKFIQEQRMIIGTLIRDFSLEHHSIPFSTHQESFTKTHLRTSCASSKHSTRSYSTKEAGWYGYIIFGSYPKEPLHFFEGSKTTYRKAHRSTTWTALRYIQTRSLIEFMDYLKIAGDPEVAWILVGLRSPG